MKIIQTFWSGPKKNEKESTLNIKAGWLSCEYHWMSWALSCLQIKKIFGDVELVTDENGKKILIDILGLPYSSVSTELEGKLDHYPQELWALSKIYSYSIQKKPFIHIDGDVFLWDRIIDDIIHADIISQNMEINLPLYKTALDEINTHFTHIPDIFSKLKYINKDIYSSNAGLFGGKNLEFIRIYCKIAFDFIDRNKEDLSKVNASQLNFIFEQYLLYQLASEQNLPITYVIKDVVDDPVFKDYVRFEDHPFTKIIHPVGGFKRMQHICDHMAKKLRCDYPIYYYRIIDSLNKAHITMHNKIYNIFNIELNGDNSIKWKDVDLLNSNLAIKERNKVESFARTLSLIDYLNESDHWKDIAKNICVQKILDKDFLTFINNSFFDADEKERLLEIYLLESTKNKLYKDYAKTIFIEKQHYLDEVKEFKINQNIFGLSIEKILKLTFKANERIVVLEINYAWRYELKEQLKLIIEKTLNEPKIYGQVVLIPSLSRLDIEEYYLDQLDMIVTELCSERKTIEEIIDTAKSYFDIIEIENNKEDFFKLIIDTVKRLAYAGIIKYVDN